MVLQTDNTPKPQARLIGVARTAYNTLTATFDRSIRFGGYATINNGASMVGLVDEKDTQRVHYTISDADAQRTGAQTISITGWQGAYNVNPNDTTSYQSHTRPVNFDVERSNPILLRDEFDPETSVLTLTYNREVILSSNTGTFNATVLTLNNERWPNNNVNYIKLASEDPKVIKLQLTNMTLFGNYSFTLDQYFVSDSFRNYGLPRPISIDNTGGGSSDEFPGPYLVTQSATNPSEIFIEFMNMLDVASATDVRNYHIPGVTVLSARLEKNTKSEGSIVVLTIADGTIDITLERPLTINKVTDYDGRYSPLVDYKFNVLLRDNKKPYFVNPPVYDRTKLNEIHLTFSEEITGSMSVRVTQIGQYSYEIGNRVEVSGYNVVIILNNIPDKDSTLRIDVIENKIVDLSGNQSAPMNTQLMVRAAY